MGYMSRSGKRPPEYASRASHGNVINDKDVKLYLDKCSLPKRSSEVSLNESYLYNFKPISNNQIQYIIAIDGGYSEVVVQKEFPSATIAFFQIGALHFSIEDLENLSYQPFIDPEDIKKIKEIERQKLTIPVKNITFKNEQDLIDSIRKTIHEYFINNPDSESFLRTLKWFIFQEYENPIDKWQLATCPGSLVTDNHMVEIKRNEIDKEYSIICPHCNSKVFLTDVFRLHEAIDNELGAGGILGYLITTLEQILLIHIIRLALNISKSLFKQILFIKDGPLGFFGQTARMHKPMRNLCNYMIDNYDLNLIGLEKSGAFVEHADEIKDKLKPGDVLFLSNDYIYKYIIPGIADNNKPYARTSYYSSKFIFKSNDEKLYVATMPVKDEKVVLNPKKDDFYNIDIILTNIEKLKCDMYDNSLMPVALANKLVSLSNHPSTVILEKFAKKNIK